ncbi:hypothetical protein NMG60_11025949 [Bertholletia excelsa]
MERTSVLCLFFVVCSVSSSFSIASANELSLVVSQSTTLQISPTKRVENSPGFKPGVIALCERIQIHGLSRLKNLRKFSDSVKVNVSFASSGARVPTVEICFHRNLSLGIGMCPQGRWEKLPKGSWVQSMSPFDHKVLDICMAGSSLENFQVSLVEEFFLYRIILLVLGIMIMALASPLSKSLVFYYSSAMGVGIILVILVVLFQGMKLLPTGRKNSVAIFLYSSTIGLGSFLLRYIPRLLRSVLAEIGISEDMYNPLATFVLVFLVLIGAWLGFWIVRKVVLTDEGLIDRGVSHFVAWSIWIIAAVMILQSSVDPLLAAEALSCGVLASSVLRRITRSRFIRHLNKKFRRMHKIHRSRHQIMDQILEDSYDEYLHSIKTPDSSKFLMSQSRPFRMASCNTSIQGSRKPPAEPSDSDTFYSSYHVTPERRKFSKDEWGKFTKESTKKALEELVSSPDFSKWAVAHADRITLTPTKDAANHGRRWLPWS